MLYGAVHAARPLVLCLRYQSEGQAVHSMNMLHKTMLALTVASTNGNDRSTVQVVACLDVQHKFHLIYQCLFYGQVLIVRVSW